MSPPDALDGMTPDDQSFSEATGNEGASFERSYSRAALILWPRRDRLAVVNQGGLPATLPLLAGLADRWAAGGAAASVRDEAHALAGHMIETWPAGRRNASQMLTEVATMLDALRRLSDLERIDAFLEEVTAQGRYGAGQAEHVLSALSALPPGRAAALCTGIVAGNAPTVFAGASDMLATAPGRRRREGSASRQEISCRPRAHSWPPCRVIRHGRRASPIGAGRRRSNPPPWRMP